jgi:AcrR family transcriptional regulator
MARTGKKQEIVAAAVALMAAGGAEALTASALAARAGVSKANLFHHFDSLDDIVLAAFEEFTLGMDTLRSPPPPTLRAWLEALMAEATQSVAATPRLSGAYLALVSRARSEPRLRARLEEVVDGIDAAFAEIVRQFRPDLEERQLRALATLVLVAGDGLVIHSDLFPARAEAQAAAWRAFIDLVAGKETPP